MQQVGIASCSSLRQTTGAPQATRLFLKKKPVVFRPHLAMGLALSGEVYNAQAGFRQDDQRIV